MRIHELEVTNIRGIRHVTLQLAGENIVVWGPNGSGKSAVVDAVDFLLRGSIGRLEGEGTGSISTLKHGPHVDAAVSSAHVRALVSLPGVDHPFEISRTMGDPASLQCSDEGARAALEPVLEITRQGHYVLARREILKFITATGGNRAKWIQSLMRLDSLESVRATLVSAANDAKKQAIAATGVVDTERTAFTTTASMTGWTEDSGLAVINLARATLGAPEITRLEPGRVREGVTAQAIAKADMNAVRLGQALEQMRRFDLAELRASADELFKAAATLSQDVEALKLLRRHNLIHAGLELLGDDGKCPLCGAEWEQGELEARLTEELRLSVEVAKKREDLEGLVSGLLPRAAAIRQVFSTVQETASPLGLVDQESLFATVVNNLERYEAALGTPIDKLTPETAQMFGLPPVSDEGVEAQSMILADQVAALTPEISPEQAAWDLLTRLHDALDRVRIAEQKVRSAGILRTRADALRDSYGGAKDDVLNALYNTIKARFVDLYSQLHAEDGEDAFEALLEHDGASLDFHVDFYRRGLHPPHALHSEGHQDSMGICLYLALSEHVNRGIVGVLVLDDVVMSVDSGHRRRLCRVLKEQFLDTQFVITTHDRGWAHQLKTEGVVAPEGMVQFCGWNVDTGPRVNELDVWERIDNGLAADDVRGAAGHLRGAMEEFFANACENLQARVIYRASGQYTLGDFLPAAFSRYSELVKLAKASATSWGNDEAVDRLIETHSVAKQCYGRTQAEQWAANKALHYDAWYTLEAADLREVVDAFRDLCEVFQCPDCRAMLTVSTTDYQPDSVRCACKRLDWNLVKRTAS
ncbi:MAG: AAA family ATPase [Actinobacteria bacterium]|nr:AAA family ATPase [Actinomycetota bacterium]